MEDISLHLLDIAENAINAGATIIVITIEEEEQSGRMIVEVEDNGKGMDTETLKKVIDPFYTTKEGKRTGLGVPLFAQSAEETGGKLSVQSNPGEGSKITAVFNRRHPDMRPLGDVDGTIRILEASHPEIYFRYEYNRKL